MGKRQRLTQFTGLSDQEVAKLARDTNADAKTRKDAIREEKYRKRRNRQKRSK